MWQVLISYPFYPSWCPPGIQICILKLKKIKSLTQDAKSKWQTCDSNLDPLIQIRCSFYLVNYSTFPSEKKSVTTPPC